MSISIIRFAVLLATCCICCESANILAFPTFPGYSHFIIIEPLLRALANKGHNVTVVSYFPRKTPLKNYHDIDVSHTLPLVTNNISAEYCLKNMRKSTDFMQFVWGSGHKMCHAIFNEKNIMDDLLNNGVKYDLVITELFGADCFVAFAHVFKVPLISIVTTVGLPWAHDRIGNPVNPSYITNYFRPVKHPMTLYDRFMNTATFLYANAGYYFVSDLSIDKFTNEYFNNTLPPLAEIYKKTSVIMTNSHYSFREIQPFLPNFIEIGGIHLEPPKPLPKDLQELLDNSKEGVILVTFGSMLKSSSLPENILNSFKRAFARLPYKVIWKVEDHVADLPPNVVTKKWLPVKDVLEHPNMKLLIMHGGMATTIEAINAGVPVLGMPMYADQPGNIQSLINKGMAIGVDYYEITEELLYNSIKKLITDPSFTENAKTLSKVFKDREHSPLDTAVYWTEYVIRHKGAPHLQSSAVNMPWYQLMLLDVILLTFVSLSFAILVIYFLIVSIKKFLFGSLTKKRKQA